MGLHLKLKRGKRHTWLLTVLMIELWDVSWSDALTTVCYRATPNYQNTAYSLRVSGLERHFLARIRAS